MPKRVLFVGACDAPERGGLLERCRVHIMNKDPVTSSHQCDRNLPTRRATPKKSRFLHAIVRRIEDGIEPRIDAVGDAFANNGRLDQLLHGMPGDINDRTTNVSSIGLKSRSNRFDPIDTVLRLLDRDDTMRLFREMLVQQRDEVTAIVEEQEPLVLG